MPRVEDEARVLYAVYPGYVWSANDGDRHFISAQALISLYGVAPCECRVATPFTHPAELRDLIPLRPRYDGSYNIGHVIQEMPWA